MTKLEICELEKKDERAWDEYILKSEHSTFYNQIDWKNVVEKTYKHKPVYLIAKENGEIRGVLPLFLMKTIFFGKKLVSVPFAPYGGICADNKTVEKRLLKKLRGLQKWVVRIIRSICNKKDQSNMVKTMPRWLSRHSARFVIERSLVQIQPGAF